MGDKIGFVFRDPGVLADRDLELVLVSKYPGDPKRAYVPAYQFHMRHAANGPKTGRIELRVGNTDHVVMYAGHIGYRVEPEYRGRRYAERSCRLLFPLARRHGLNPLWITCNPDNTPSRLTIERLGGVHVETVPIPETHAMYRRGERLKCRYRIDL